MRGLIVTVPRGARCLKKILIRFPQTVCSAVLFGSCYYTFAGGVGGLPLLANTWQSTHHWSKPGVPRPMVDEVWIKCENCQIHLWKKATAYTTGHREWFNVEKSI